MPARILSPGGLALLAIGLSAVIPYLQGVSSYFLSDDFGLIWLFSQKPALHFLTLFTSPWVEDIYGYAADELRPLIALSYQVDYWLGGINPLAYHLDNLVFHALNSALVFTMARYLLRLDVVPAAFAGVLFAVMPVHVEAVGWISGRADLIPAFFYLSTALSYAAWRRTGGRRWYVLSLCTFFLALFSKQSAITMVATLVLFDVLIERRRIWLSVNELLPYLPHAAFTFGYLALRYVLFGNAVREQTLSMDMVNAFLLRQKNYLQMIGSGVETLGLGGADRNYGGLAMGVTMLALLLAAAYYAYRSAKHRSLDGLLAAFGPLLFAVTLVLTTLAPLLVTYHSSRHLYLVSVGIVLGIALGFGALWGERRDALRGAAVVLAAGLLVGQAVVLTWAVGEWNHAARLSEKIRADVEREALAAPEGTLFILGAPPTGGTQWLWSWLWGFSMPFALEPPFTPETVGNRAAFVTRVEVFCCPGSLWQPEVRNTVNAWSASSTRPPVIALAWSVPDSNLIKVSDRDDPALRQKALSLADAPSPAVLAGALDDILRPLGGTATYFRTN